MEPTSERDHHNEGLLHKVFPANGDKAWYQGELCTVGDDLALRGEPERVRVNYSNAATRVVNKQDLKPYNLIEEYFKLQEEVHKYFGYVEDWVVIPLDPQMGRHWMICGPEDSNSTQVAYSDHPFTPELINKGKECYSGNIYTQRFLKQWVYRGRDYTMVAVDTRCDGNKLLMIFSNSLECCDETLKSQYAERWGYL